MDQPAIAPQVGRAPAIDPATFGRGRAAGHDDGGRPLVVVDARNAFEVAEGRGARARARGRRRVSAIPPARARQAESRRGKTVVTYCTGGIRCEKAALAMAAAGLEHVYQLDGGVLALLRASGGAHFDGHCVVFDERGALDQALQPREPLSPPPGDSAAPTHGAGAASIVGSRAPRAPVCVD
jgi:UPF0176 protein